MTKDDFSGWDTETLRTYVSTMEKFMIGSMQEDPMAPRYAIRLQAARDELDGRQAATSCVKVSFGPEGSYRSDDPGDDA